jgi:multisite-specific tRNA:(cytosine-C5)-methyltransferase
VSPTYKAETDRSDAETINDIIKSTYVPEMQDVEVDGLRIEPPMQLPWYPGGLAWQVDAPKRVVRKSLPFKTFQRFLVGETEVVRCSPHKKCYKTDQQGNLSRQEAVSMIPPLFLNVEPHHRVSTAITISDGADYLVSRHVRCSWLEGERDDVRVSS